MDSYIEISIKPGPEMRLNRLLNAIYGNLHKALCDLHSTNIGVSFPEYQFTLGNVLRIHGDDLALNNLRGMAWLVGTKNYFQIGDITPVPFSTKFRRVSRKQPTMSPAKLRRLIKRGSITEEDAKNYKTKLFTKGLDNPYLELTSGSNGQRHRRYIEFGPLLDNPIEGSFDQFGLSKTATIPWF